MNMKTWTVHIALSGALVSDIQAETKQDAIEIALERFADYPEDYINLPDACNKLAFTVMEDIVE
jgi:hypothetical protein